MTKRSSILLSMPQSTLTEILCLCHSGLYHAVHGMGYQRADHAHSLRVLHLGPPLARGLASSHCDEHLRDFVLGCHCYGFLAFCWLVGNTGV